VSLGQPAGCGEKRAHMFSASLSFDTLIIAVEALKEVAQNIGRLVTDVKSNKHHYSTSQATKCECG
jgi:hypothetical protein